MIIERKKIKHEPKQKEVEAVHNLYVCRIDFVFGW